MSSLVKEKIDNLATDCDHLKGLLVEAIDELMEVEGSVNWGVVSRLTHLRHSMILSYSLACGIDPEDIEIKIAKLKESKSN